MTYRLVPAFCFTGRMAGFEAAFRAWYQVRIGVEAVVDADVGANLVDKLSEEISKGDEIMRPPGERLNGRDASAVASWGDRNPMRDLSSLCRKVSSGATAQISASRPRESRR